MPNTAVIDTGPLYALFDRDDQYHARTVEFVAQGKHVLVTTFAVVTETCFLLHRCPHEGHIDFLRWIQAGGLQIIDVVGADYQCIIDVIRRYEDLPADFADATLVAVADRMRIREIATFDKDFRVYRYRHRAAFRICI